MRDFPVFRKATIRYWERRRIYYNLALVLPALFGYGIFAGFSAGVGDPRHFGSGIVCGLFLLATVGANICYSFGYALEFLFGSDDPNSSWIGIWRPLLIVVGTLFAMTLAVIGGRNIALIEYSLR